MPSRNTQKIYFSGAYYHVYNRGVNKQKIFSHKRDYHVFLSFLKDTLLPVSTDDLVLKLTSPHLSPLDKRSIINKLNRQNFANEIDLLCYVLMPNHFHLLIKQHEERSMEKFMRSLMDRYVRYYNLKYNRVGSLFQGKYKAVLVDSEAQLLHLSRYLHRNSINNLTRSDPKRSDLMKMLISQPSSLPVYLGQNNFDWVKSQDILGNFKRDDVNTYLDFIKSEDPDLQLESALWIKDISFEED